MPGSDSPGASGAGFPALRLAPAWLIAALPGTVVLQLLPRIIDDQQLAAAGTVLGWAGTLLPLLAAVVAGLVAAAVTGAGGPAGLRVGWAAQVPALPGFLAIQAGLFQRGFYFDGIVFAGLLAAHLALSTWLAGYAGQWWATTQTEDGGPRGFATGVRGTLGLASAALGSLALAIIVVSNPLAPLEYAVVLGCAGGALGYSVWRSGSGPAQGVGVPVMMGGIAVAAFAVSLLSGELLPVPDLEEGAP